MAGGINHAKKIVIDEAICLAEKLQNGDAACAETQGKAIALIVKMITPLYEAEFITVEECRRKHAHKTTNADVEKKIIKLKLGPLALEGNFSPMLFLVLLMMVGFGCLIYALGKSETWW